MRNPAGLFSIALILFAAVAAADSVRDPAPPVRLKTSHAVDVVICLDVSGSMGDLLNSVRARVWDVVGELGRMQPTPRLRVGLLTYGMAAASEERGFLKIQHDLTDDLDGVYADLMTLTTSGNNEYVGRALEVALDEMSWSSEWDALRVIFVAGNESADQAREITDFRLVARDARDADVIINAIYAGKREQAVVEAWPEVGRAGGGTFSSIDPELHKRQIETPDDARLLELNQLLNKTYLPYGENGETGLANQLAQDNNASRLGVQSCSSRIVAKGTALYNNASWDLVDAALREDFEWSRLDEDDLPELLRPMSLEERAAYVERMRQDREAVQSEIQAVSERRENYIRAALSAEELQSDLAQAMRTAIREQAIAKGFTCDDC